MRVAQGFHFPPDDFANGIAGQATQYPADGGIDGIIKKDPLSLELIYLQAKRDSEGTGGRPDGQRFAGALAMTRARKRV